MKYFMGIDQGGSKTAAIVGDEYGHILGMGISFGAVHSVDGMEVAMKAAEEAFDQALNEAGLSYKDIYGLYGGMSGIDWAYEKELVQNAMYDHFKISHISIVNDCLIAMRAATDSDKCGIICAGSGVNCAVRNGKKEIIFGYYIPDSIQGGVSIGAAAVQKVFDAQAGVGAPTILTDYLCELFHAESVDELLQMRAEHKIGSNDYLGLPKVVEKAALEGDKVAIRIYEDFAKGIVPYILSGMRTLDILEEKVDIVLSGSIFKCKVPVLRETVDAELRKEAANINIIDSVYEPIVGAFLMGLDDYHKKVPSEVYAEIEKEKNKYNILRNVKEDNT
ncbi:N-acetylglucosamine kinase [Blautia sp. HCP3S3_H10_1]|uniref:N-acetylglucosamine kinase n=1 Tax=unclassified Blautia TaxID=2648079 RepID=UPI003F925520